MDLLGDNITRTCGSDGMWDGSEPTCIRKEVRSVIKCEL